MEQSTEWDDLIGTTFLIHLPVHTQNKKKIVLNKCKNTLYKKRGDTCAKNIYRNTIRNCDSPIVRLWASTKQGIRSPILKTILRRTWYIVWPHTAYCYFSLKKPENYLRYSNARVQLTYYSPYIFTGRAALIISTWRLFGPKGTSKC